MAMKESGIEWVGLIPNTWSVIPNKYVMHKEKNLCEKWTGEDVMSLTMNGVIVRDLQNPTGKMPATFDGYQYIEDGDLLMCLFDIDVTPRCVGKVTHDGVTSPAYSNFKIHDNASRDYFYYYYLMVDNTKELLHLAKNLRHSFTEKQLGQLKVPMPPLSEQKAIADYLDETCSKIDEIIAEAKASIDEYKELKQSVIFEAVTKGFDKNVEMKAVNLEYLDSCPLDWNILPVSILFDFFGGFAYKSDRFCEETNNQVVRLGNVKDDELRLNSNPVYVSDEYADDSSKAAIKVDDILFTMTGTRGKGDYFYTLIITEDDLKEKNLFLNQRVGCFRKAYHTVYMPYYNYLLKSPKIRERVFLYETGTANQGNIGIENINRIRLYNPPMEVQKNIVRMLNQKCNTIDSLITEKESLINDLETYKKSLIYEVVTGKRRVV